ncbi:hypothetical protein PR202_gb24385 [Eleusine coracana subsp. coracana]|uniref:DUF295 domain-containing protein n=1 Tax=Eleusine coracana subsp. coracana TaxID=191504 RepID=A0AAV5FIJ8_ELECO|nr:hypothetical protein PR202_gb24385 [Eleusine coracana subsp. coracana]
MAAAVDQDSDLDSWVDIDPDNPANSSDDDAGVRSLSSGRTTPDCCSDDEHLGDLALSSRRRSRAPSPPSPTTTAPTTSTTSPTPSYASFDPIRSWSEKVLVPDPSFSACNESVTVLASTRGLVCLRANASGNYIVANPATYERVRLPRHACDHSAYGDPAVVITFENAYTCCDDHRDHYHVVVAFPLGDGVYAYESFSSRTWEWTVAAGVDAVEQVISASGVGALGRAFWRTTLGYFLCYNPAAGAATLVPAPQEVLDWPYWELGCMDNTLCVTCMNELVKSVAVTRLQLETSEDGAEVFNWSFGSYFEGGCLRNRRGVELLRSQGPEVVFWDPNLELVFAMDTEGRTTRTIGPLSGRQYYSDFIPYVSSSTGITR